TDHRTTNGARCRVRRWRWLVGSYRRRIGVGNVVGVILGDIGGRAIHRLRVVIPDASDIPPITIAPIVYFVMPASTLPGEVAAVGMSAEIVRRRRAAREPRIRSPARRGARRPPLECPLNCSEGLDRDSGVLHRILRRLHCAIARGRSMALIR